MNRKRKSWRESCRFAVRTIGESLKGTEEDFTTGPFKRAILLLAIPMMLEMLMESVFAIVDIFFVAKLGADAIATLGITEALIILLYAVAIGLSMAVTAVVARRIGEGDRESAALAAGQALSIGFVLSIVISIPGVIYAEDILRAMGMSADAIAEHVGYTKIMFGGCGSILFIFLLNGVFRGAGDASVAMRVLWIANLINIVLDPVLIFGWGPFPELGLTGAAVATTIGRSCGVGLQLVYLFGGASRVRLRANHIVPRYVEVREIAALSKGAVMQYLIATSSWVILVKIVATYGSTAVAGYTIAIRIVDFIILPAWGLSNAAATLVGQNLGAAKPERAERFAWQVTRYNLVFMVSIGIIFIIIPNPIVGLFTSDEGIRHAAVICLRFMSFGFGFFAVSLVLHQAFNGAGDTSTPMRINFVAFWLIQLPLAYYLAMHWFASPTGVYVAILISEFVMSAITLSVFRRGRWKFVQV